MEDLEDLRNQIAQLVEENKNLQNEIEDLKTLYETIAEHSSTIENELDDKNQVFQGLLNQLKKYLSPQLYNSIVGGKSEVSLSYKRKFLTVFFSDIVSFTEISDRTEPEILSEMLNGYLNDMAQIALEFGGTIDKFIGDALMIFFGDPEYTNDQKHAEDCCAMALKMQDAVAKINKNWIKKGIPQGLSVRMGINSGYCTVGNFGSENRMDYTIIGGSVNLASRLESQAKPNTIFISAVTKNLLSNNFKTEYEKEVAVKGILAPVQIFNLVGYEDANAVLSGKDIISIENNVLKFEVPTCDLSKVQGMDYHKLKDALTKALELLG